MFLKKLDNDNLNNFPVVIIGSAPAGITTALELEQKNINTNKSTFKEIFSKEYNLSVIKNNRNYCYGTKSIYFWSIV